MVIIFLVVYFETILGWTHGKEFQFIASMNTMVALIGGATIHSFGEVPIREDQSIAKKKKNRDKLDVCTMFSKCENMRVFIVYESSSASCES